MVNGEPDYEILEISNLRAYEYLNVDAGMSLLARKKTKQHFVGKGLWQTFLDMEPLVATTFSRFSSSAFCNILLLSVNYIYIYIQLHFVTFP